MQHWLTWISCHLWPDSHRDGRDHTDHMLLLYTHTHTLNTQSLELIMEIQLLTRVLSTIMSSRLLLLRFNKWTLVLLAS